MTTILAAADWVRRISKVDADVRVVFERACAARGYANAIEFAQSDPDGFMPLYEACRDMVTQIPEDQLRQVGKGKPNA